MKIAVLVGLLTSALSGIGQDSSNYRPISRDRGPVLRVDTNLVLVPVTVTDSRGAVVPNLSRADFVLNEQKQRQEIISFSHETAAVSLGILVDLSGSMANKIAEVQVAVGAILDNLEPDDEEFLETFANVPDLRWPFTSRISEIQSALWFGGPHGSTALFDAVALAADQMHRAQNTRKVIFLISDGGDNHSRLTERELRLRLDEEDVQIHAIGIHDHMSSREGDRGAKVLEDLAVMTGGQHHMIRDKRQLPAIAGEMSLALHDRYLLGYKPTPLGPSGQFRRIDVRLVQPKGAPRLYVYARRGYRMP